ncbi:DUF924 family protein [Sneathiella limimaris]|uniref:DUF924 family protein n=1 Tax=Sneathiella limimaris TaxID=1964213 RepID=UPI00146C12FC|nr:DUF924 family protein [Sneathiella limimaris]
MTSYQEILDFWFLPENHPDHGRERAEWFQKNEEFDRQIKDQFQDVYEKAKQGYLLSWTDHKAGTLALIILFDQFTRNMFRGDKQAFESDGKARELARHMISSGFYEKLSKTEQCFAALPFEHSEDIEDQIYSVSLFEAIGDPVKLDYAIRHKDIIEKFGRFPHRNEALGRKNTPEEEEYLAQPGAGF